MNNNQRKEAQEVFLDFQKTKNPFILCRNILESSAHPYVKFQAGCTLKAGVTRDWTYLQQDGRNLDLLNYLIDYVKSRENLETYVKEQLLLVSAIILKRCGIDESSTISRRLMDQEESDKMNQNSVLYKYINTLYSTITSSLATNCSPTIPTLSPTSVQTPNIPIHQQITAASFLFALLSEYSSSTRASDVGLPWIKHLEAKKKFELNYLKNCFSAALQGLHNLNLQANLSSPLHLTYFQKLVQIIEAVLSWNFDLITIISSQYAKHVDSIESPILQPGIEWRDVLVNENVIQFIFLIYITCRSLNQESLINHSLQSLSQLSSLTGSIISTPKARLRFINCFMNGTIAMLNSGLHPYEVIPISSMLHRLCLHLQNRETIRHVNKEMSQNFISLLTQLTCKLLMDCVKAELSSSPETEGYEEKYKQAVDNLCDAWMVMLQAVHKYEQGFYEYSSSPDEVDGNSMGKRSSSQPPDEIVDASVVHSSTRQIFECFLKCHLTQPEGFRSIATEPEKDIQEFEEEDGQLFSEQLNAMGSIGRVDPKSSLNLLTEIMSLRVKQYQACLESMVRDPNSVSSSTWAGISEDVHWLLMISTATLCQCNYGEKEVMPPPLLKLSVNEGSDANKSVFALQNLDDSADFIDPVIRLIILILKLCPMEKHLQENGMLSLLSPQVSASLSTFLSRFMAAYLLPSEYNVKEVSLSLNICFGRDSTCAEQLLNMIVEHILSKLIAWTSEEEVSRISAESLTTFIKDSKERNKYLIETPAINCLWSAHGNGQLTKLPSESRKIINHLLTMMASVREQFWDQLFEPLNKQYSLIQKRINNGDISEVTRSSLIQFIDSISGITLGCNPSNVLQIWNRCLKSLYVNDLAKLLHVFHNYKEVVLSLLELVQLTASRILCYLENPESQSYYEATIGIINTYVEHNKGRKLVEEEEEEASQDILLIMTILNDLAAKDFIDWYPAISDEEKAKDGNLTGTQVVFMGLNIVMPLMSIQLLQMPKLAQNYYKLIAFLCEDPERLLEVPQPLLVSIMATVEHALKAVAFSSEIKCNCLSMLSILGGHCLRDPEGFQPMAGLLEPFLGIILEFTLLDSGSSRDVTLREHVANTMFTMICCFSATYERLVGELVLAQVSKRMGEVGLAEELRRVFAELMDKIPLQSTRIHRSAFKQRFENFVAQLQALLYIK